jgi:hypothetical protein
MRQEGFPSWTRSIVAALENGGRRVGLEELVGLAITFWVPLASLVGPSDPSIEWVSLSEGAQVKPRALLRIFRGANPGDLDARNFRSPRTGREIELLGQASLLLRQIVALAPDASLEQISVAARGELERHVARRLDLKQPELVAAAAYHLWGHSATEERERRAADRPTAKQHISRDLVAEIAGVLAETDRGVRKA